MFDVLTLNDGRWRESLEPRDAIEQTYGVCIRQLTSDREYRGGSVYAASYPQDAVSALHDARDARVLLHERPEGTVGRLYPGIGRSTGRARSCESNCPPSIGRIRLQALIYHIELSSDTPTSAFSTLYSITPNSRRTHTNGLKSNSSCAL